MAYYVDYGIRIKGKKDACDSIYNSIDNLKIYILMIFSQHMELLVVK